MDAGGHRIEHPRVLERRARGGSIGLLEEDASAQRQQAGIVGESAKPAVDGLDRPGRLLLRHIGAREIGPGHRGGGRERRRLLEVGRGLGGPLRLEQAAAEVVLDVEGGRGSSGQAREDPDRPGEIRGAVETQALAHLPLVGLELGEMVLRVGARRRSREEAASQVAQRRELLGGVRGRVGRRRGTRHGGLVATQARPHAAGDLTLSGEQVLRLARIVGDAVQLGSRSIDVLPPVAAQRAQRRVAEVQAPVEALGIRLAFRYPGSGTQVGRPGHAARGRRGKREQLEQAGEEVDAPELAGNARARR